MAGINLHISRHLSLNISADCCLPPAAVAILAPGYRMHININAMTDIKDFDQARTKVANTYLCRNKHLKKTR